VSDGAQIVVTRRGRPIARLSGVETSASLEDLVSRGLVTPAQQPRKPRRASVKARGSVSALIAEQRC
jgi:antitoxin (DNA-binding transcriptional repressor) of toxin-antitoxin stability system